MKTPSVLAAAAAIAFAPFLVVAPPASALPCGSAMHPAPGQACSDCVYNATMAGGAAAIGPTCIDGGIQKVHYPDCDGLEPTAHANCDDKHMLDGDPGQPG
jgi:hypothetical protein